MTTVIIALFLLIFLAVVYYLMASEISHEVGQHIGSQDFALYVDLCRQHGLTLDVAELPDRDGDESFRRFSFTKNGVTRILRPRATFKVLQHLKTGDVSGALAMLKLA